VGSLCWFTQTPEHSVVPPVHAHEPSLQAWPPGQVRPQEPQLVGSFSVSTQLPPQATVPSGQTDSHLPVAQTWSALHFSPQAPQWLGSLSVATQMPPQSAVPTGHAHLPATQVVPFPQTVPQVPQLASSDWRSTQEPLHAERGAVQSAAQVPELQSGVPPSHFSSHAPQWFGSSEMSTHAPEQLRVPAGQAQALSAQISVPPHDVAQVPQ
jgi:hypothetical protein